MGCTNCMSEQEPQDAPSVEKQEESEYVSSLEKPLEQNNWHETV